MTRRNKKSGKCLLLGSEGPFARSHIIPRFVGDKALGQAHRIEMRELGERPKLVFNSWTDPELCGQKGEERLRDIDTAGSKVFQKQGLSWRHFPLTDASKRTELGDSEIELIELSEVDATTLRMFFLSVLWRCAASTRVQFAEISMPPAHLEYLRQIVAGETEPNDSDWPATLLLLTSKGEPQIQAPMAQEIDLRSLGFDLPSVPIFRFFFDGLIVHMGRSPADDTLLDNWGGRVVGVDDKLTMMGRPYEKSWQEDNLYQLQHELLSEHAEDARKIYKTLRTIDQQNK